MGVISGGWPIPLKKKTHQEKWWSEFVSWDDELPNMWENKIHVPNHQPD
jgi:hypothetical protein